MRRVIILLGVFMLIGLQGFEGVALAKETELPDESVYCTEEEQEAIWNLMQTTDWGQDTLEKEGVRVLKESISRIYTADLCVYAETGVLEMEHRKASNFKTQRDDGKRYMAKLVYEDGTFATNLRLVVWGNYEMITHVGLSWDTEHNLNVDNFSSSYVDHARRIQRIMRTEEIIPESNVRLLSIEKLGLVFYVTDGEKEMLIPVGMPGNHGEEPSVESYGLGDGSFRNVAKEYKKEYDELMAYIEEWKKQHPGQEPYIGGIEGIDTYIEPDEIDNIININEYLVANTEKQVNEPTSWATYLPWLAAASAVILAGGVMLVVLQRKKNQGNLSDVA